MRKPTRTPAQQREYDAKRGPTPHRRYTSHRKNAKRRGIQFLITFDEWWSIWEASGHWPNYGSCWGQYVMARHGDQGAYEVGNVSIIQCRLNSRENANRINFPAIGRAARAKKRRGE